MAKISTEREYRCAKCGELFDSMKRLEEHNSDKHGRKSPLIGQTTGRIESQLPDQPAEVRT